eukprot:UN03207
MDADKRMTADMNKLSQKSRDIILQSQPMDVGDGDIESDDSEDDMSSIEGLHNIIPRTPDKTPEKPHSIKHKEGTAKKKKSDEVGVDKMNVDAAEDIDGSSSDDDDGQHFGV